MTDTESANAAKVRWVKIRGMLGQIQTLSLWKKANPESEYYRCYQRLGDSPALKNRFSVLYGELFSLHLRSYELGISEGEYKNLCESWDSILAALFPRPV